MPISDLCSRSLICVEPGASLHCAARVMKKHHVGDVVVVEQNGKDRPVGILTDRDIVLNVVAENRPTSGRVDEFMSKDIVTVNQSEGIAAVIDKMEREGVRRVIVMDDEGNACGLVSCDDLIQLLAREMHGIGRLVEKQLQGDTENRHSQGRLMI
jgi:CBS domain-containing protein